MSKLKQVLQLHQSGASNRSIASQLELSKTTVNKYIHRFKALSIGLDELLKLENPELEHIFTGGNPAYTDKRFDEWSTQLSYFVDQLKDRHVTRHLLWEEYILEHPGGYRFTQFCFHLNQNKAAAHPSTVLTGNYVPAEKVFVDFSGDLLQYIDVDTGEIIKVQTFVACLPCTDYGFAICVPSPNCPNGCWTYRGTCYCNGWHDYYEAVWF